MVKSIQAKKVEPVESPGTNEQSSRVREEMSKAFREVEKPLLKVDETTSQEVDSEEEQETEEGQHETSEQQEKRIRKQSIFGHLKTWKLLRIIVKSGDDLRQEQFAMQLIMQIDQIFKRK